MTTKIQNTVSTITIIFQERTIRYAFILLLPLITLLLYSIPVISIPGNDPAFQLQLFTPLDFLLLFVVAALESLLLVMMFYMLRQRQLSGVGQGNLGLLSAIPVWRKFLSYVYCGASRSFWPWGCGFCSSIPILGLFFVNRYSVPFTLFHVKEGSGSL